MFKMQFSTNNDAFEGSECYAETARLLRIVADNIEKGTRKGILHDINGNNVGAFMLDKPEEVEG